VFSPRGPSLRELTMQALSSVEGGYDRLAPKFDHTPFRTPDGVLDATADALRPLGPFGRGLDVCWVGAPQRVTSRWYWALLGFDLAMRVRNAVWRPPFIMYYGTCPLHAVCSDLTASGFTVATVPLTALGRREDGSPRCRLVLARRASSPANASSLPPPVRCPGTAPSG
jgi:hypothetical protein